MASGETKLCSRSSRARHSTSSREIELDDDDDDDELLAEEEEEADALVPAASEEAYPATTMEEAEEDPADASPCPSPPPLKP
jgi:hypothetical protein